MIEFDDVRLAFGPAEVLRGVSLRVSDGETVVLLGPSGAGKTVLLKTVIGLLEPDGGDVRVDGRSVPNAPSSVLAEVRAQVGYVFQFSALFDSLTVEENVALGLCHGRCRPEAPECRDRVEQALRAVNLDPTVGGRMPAELSGGMRKRVAIARAIVGGQRYVLYDEPTTGLDPVNAAVIADLVRRLQEGWGVTSLVVTHDLEIAARVGDRWALLWDGRIRLAAPPHVFRRTEDPAVRAFLGRAAERPVLVG